MTRFSFATLLPVLLLFTGAFSGGWWISLALIYMTLLTLLLDLVVKITPTQQTESEFPAENSLLIAIAVLHFPLLACVVLSLSTFEFRTIEKMSLFIAAGLFFGQVGNSTAHELIHRGQRGLHRLGMWMYISLLFGHHTSAHVLVHHKHVATANDPSSAPIGQSYYRFAVRAWVGSFRKGYEAEAERLARIGRSPLHNPYWVYVAGALVFTGLAYGFLGSAGMLIYIALVSYSTSQLLISDYVQHYGLRRAIGDNGKPVPVDDRHSWNSTHWFSSALMLNAPRHSDHHGHPSRTYAELSLPKDGPMLPRSIPAMAALALFPPLWRRVMDPRAKKWQET